MAKFTLSPKYSLHFEYAMILLFGDKADHIAWMAAHEGYTKEWLRRAVKRFSKDINSLDTTERHKEMLVMQLENIDGLLKKGGNIWEVVFSFFNLTARLLGYDYHRTKKLITPVYFQTLYQNFWAGLYKGEDWRKYEGRKASFIAKRLEVIKQLKKENYTDFDISMIFNTTEYYIKKVLRENPP